MRLFHGTDPDSAAALAGGAELDIDEAQARHTDGALGFYLASEWPDAEFFAVRLGPGLVVTYDVYAEALESLLVAGCAYRPIPLGAASPLLTGSELYVPPAAFELFNELVKGGEISVHG